MNIGRRLENHLVIDDPRISRNHAQLRAIKGRFVLFDLNSTGGTFVNGQRTSQTVLYPGDVFSLAGVALIFGQDIPPPRPDLMETSPLSDPGSNDRPTATLDNQLWISKPAVSSTATINWINDRTPGAYSANCTCNRTICLFRKNIFNTLAGP